MAHVTAIALCEYATRQLAVQHLLIVCFINHKLNSNHLETKRTRSRIGSNVDLDAPAVGRRDVLRQYARVRFEPER